MILPDSVELRAAAFPKLDEAQIARLSKLGRRRSLAEGDILFEPGAVNRAFFVILSGSLEITTSSPRGEVLITAHEKGEFTGEIDMLSGRRSLVRGRARTACELLEVDRASLRRIVDADTAVRLGCDGSVGAR